MPHVARGLRFQGIATGLHLKVLAAVISWYLNRIEVWRVWLHMSLLRGHACGCALQVMRPG